MALTQDPEEVAKTCPRCRLGKSAAEFYKCKRSKLGLTVYCKECISAESKRNNLTYGKTQRRVELRRHYKLRSKYGLSLDQFKAALAEQRGLCANTACTEPATCVDHDHATGRVRKLLCKHCNLALGGLQENPERIRGLARYAEVC